MALTPNILDRSTHILRVGLKAAAAPKVPKPANLVFLVDVSGSMNGSDRLPLVKMYQRNIEYFADDDHISIVTYSSAISLALDTTAVKTRPT